MGNLSLEAKHLLKLMQMDGENRFEPLRNDKERKAMEELGKAGLVQHCSVPNTSLWVLTLRGYDLNLTKM